MGPADVLATLKEIEHCAQGLCPVCYVTKWNGHASDCQLAASIVYMQTEDRARTTLQAIADAEPATILAHGYYEAPCDRCRELIALAREGLET